MQRIHYLTKVESEYLLEESTWLKDYYPDLVGAIREGDPVIVCSIIGTIENACKRIHSYCDTKIKEAKDE